METKRRLKTMRSEETKSRRAETKSRRVETKSRRRVERVGG